MPILDTAKRHFDDDMQRARALLDHAPTIRQVTLHGDVLRASWMMGVGACDAFFSDAYADIITRALRAMEIEPSVSIPDRLNNLKVPVIAVLRQARGGWRWRMAARELIEDENVLSLGKIRQLFNLFFRTGHKLLNQDTMESWILDRRARSRLFGMTPTQYRAQNTAGKALARKDALQHFEFHFKEIFQRRHDCIHNCDRPKVALQHISHPAVEKTLQDIEFLVIRCHEALLDEFPQYLQGLGFNAVTRNSVTV